MPKTVTISIDKDQVKKDAALCVAKAWAEATPRQRWKWQYSMSRRLAREALNEVVWPYR